MPNLINQDTAGNTFYNYVTPVIRGESGSPTGDNNLDPLLAAAYGASGGNWNTAFVNSNRYKIRFPAPGLETRVGAISSGGNGSDFSNVRVNIEMGTNYQIYSVSSRTGNNSSPIDWNVGGQTSASYSLPSYVYFFVLNDYSFQYCIFTDTTLSTLFHWGYTGWLREPSYESSTVYPLGYVQMHTRQGQYLRTTAVDSTASTAISSAANSITTPPINCTVATPGADATDIVIRDAATPYAPIGKLYNCIQLPSSCNVGEIWRNTGVDPDEAGSNKNDYLCLMPWGTAKLGMRIYTS